MKQLIILFFALHFQLIFAEPAQELFKQATLHYKEKSYQNSLQSLLQIETQGNADAAVLYNIGNCYFKQNEFGKAILYYEKATILDPNEEDIQHNLKLANTKIVDRILPTPQLELLQKWDSFFQQHTSTFWAVWAILFVWIGLILFAFFLFVEPLRRLGFYAGILVVCLSFIALYLGFQKHFAEQDSTYAIVTQKNIFIKTAPDENSTDAFMLHEGAKLKLLDKVSEWTKIRLLDGKVGWIKGGFEKI